MIYSSLQVVLPVFILVLGGYWIVKLKILTGDDISGVLSFTQTVAIPTFLFLSIIKLDLGSIFNWHLIISYFFGAIICFFLGLIISFKYLGCSKSEATAIGFCILFSNAVLLGLPLTVLAYGEDSIGSNLAIISVNAPICYLLGIAVMEFTDRNSKNVQKTLVKIFKTIVSNNITMSLILGLIFNLIGIQIFTPVYRALDLISVGAGSIALFALGGVIVEYSLSKKIGKVTLIVGLSLLLHPLITFAIGNFSFKLSPDILRGAVITAAMGPGINAFLFASIYKKEMDIAAGAILVCTPLSIFATLLWIAIL